MKEKYEAAELSIVSFECDDILTASVDTGPYDTPYQPV